MAQSVVMDISNYSLRVSGRENLLNQLKCEYKEGKAYRYFNNGFIGDVSINHLEDSENYCYFKTKCLPSQQVFAKQYDAWAIYWANGQIFTPGGKTIPAYCTCIIKYKNNDHYLINFEQFHLNLVRKTHWPS